MDTRVGRPLTFRNKNLCEAFYHCAGFISSGPCDAEWPCSGPVEPVSAATLTVFSRLADSEWEGHREGEDRAASATSQTCHRTRSNAGSWARAKADSAMQRALPPPPRHVSLSTAVWTGDFCCSRLKPTTLQRPPETPASLQKLL